MASLPATAIASGADRPGRRALLGTLLTSFAAAAVTFTAPAVMAQSVTRAEAAAIARSRAGGGTVLQVRTRGGNGAAAHVVKLLNPQGQVVIITVNVKR